MFMTRNNRWFTVGGAVLVLALVMGPFAPAALAQDAPVTQDDQTLSQTPAPPPPPPAKPKPQPGPFQKGRVRVGFYGGAGSTFNQTYFILGGGAGYYLADGLEVGADVEGWLFKDPNIWKITPQIRYVVWQMTPIRPYVGAFWRQTYVEDPFDDYDSFGARGGVAYRSGGNYLAVGVVYEKFNDYKGTGDDYVVYPEVAFWLSF
jgi:hypothetical protein